jgi:hypothetical protein
VLFNDNLTGGPLAKGNHYAKLISKVREPVKEKN